MSNSLAIATVTVTLRQLLQPSLQRAVPGAMARSMRPDLAAAVRVNLFLYQVAPNAAHRNDDLPTRGADGRLHARPRAAVDLLYLISCYGADDTLEPQRLLGATVATLHAWPLLPSAEIAAAIAAEPVTLSGSDLGGQAEVIRITMEPLSTEELSRLWSTFGSVPYVLSVAYRVSAVLVEPDLLPEVISPVQTVHPSVIVADDVPATLASLTPVVPA
jgi:hypothetical protein